MTENGIFGILVDDQVNQIAATAEHSYDGMPKLPSGTYQCKIGQHELHSGPVVAFEVLNVPGHTGILLHVGNYPQTDSEGCILLGEARVGDMVTNSKLTFEKFMALEADLQEFTLTVC
jgi:hypothetical protein